MVFEAPEIVIVVLLDEIFHVIPAGVFGEKVTIPPVAPPPRL